MQAYFTEVERGLGTDRRFDDALERLQSDLAALSATTDIDAIELGARRLVETMALVLQGFATAG